MEGPVHADLLVSDSLACLPVHRRFLDGMGDARMDGDHACFRTAKTQAVRTIDRRRCGRLCAGTARAQVFWEDQCGLDRVTDCWLGGYFVAASKSAGDKTVCSLPDRH